ncbi:SDR family NAD(P)-dependent oxidoreductase [Candidatus Poseidoniales archaeon]|nr:SDR family NAD(P)-dependent oxidoreductase [Candidatus Poseidoniales archaeon]
MDNVTEFSEMHVLITGGAGFIGSNLAEELISKGSSVTVLDNLLTGHIENLSHLMGHPKFSFIEGDIRDFETCRSAVKGCTHVSHQAALGSVPRSIDDPLLSLHINILGTTNVFFAAKEEGVKRVIFASSSSVYGSDETLPKVEGITGTLLSPYASSKRSTELIQQAFVSCYDMEIIGFRYFNVFGPRQDPNGPYAAVIPKFISMMMDGKTPQIYGDGEQSRDFTHINNVVRGNILALITPDISNSNGKVLNLAYGGTTTVNEIFYGIRTSLSAYQSEIASLEPEYMGKRKGDILHSHADISRVKKSLDFSPTTDLQEGLNQTIAWYVEMDTR